MTKISEFIACPFITLVPCLLKVNCVYIGNSSFSEVTSICFFVSNRNYICSVWKYRRIHKHCIRQMLKSASFFLTQHSMTLGSTLTERFWRPTMKQDTGSTTHPRHKCVLDACDAVCLLSEVS